MAFMAGMMGGGGGGMSGGDSRSDAGNGSSYAQGAGGWTVNMGGSGGPVSGSPTIPPWIIVAAVVAAIYVMWKKA